MEFQEGTSSFAFLMPPFLRPNAFGTQSASIGCSDASLNSRTRSFVSLMASVFLVTRRGDLVSNVSRDDSRETVQPHWR